MLRNWFECIFSTKQYENRNRLVLSQLLLPIRVKVTTQILRSTWLHYLCRSIAWVAVSPCTTWQSTYIDVLYRFGRDGENKTTR